MDPRAVSGCCMKENGEVVLLKIIVVSHGDFARGILNSVQMLAGKQADVVAFGLYPHEDREILQEKVRAELEHAAPGEEVLVLSDLFHGTPFNVCVNLRKDYDFEHITGINLPLFIEIIMDRMAGKSAREICEEVVPHAADTVKDVNALLGQEDEEESEEEEE